MDEDSRRQLETRKTKKRISNPTTTSKSAHLSHSQLPVRRTKEHWSGEDTPTSCATSLPPMTPTPGMRSKKRRCSWRKVSTLDLATTRCCELLRTSKHYRWRLPTR